MLSVSEAVDRRRSVRAFLPTPVPDETIAELLRRAGRAPSGGNLQPWRLYVVNGAARDDLVAAVEAAEPQAPAYDVYPPALHEPYRTNRFTVGEQMYALLGIPRDDKAARYAHLARNFRFFDAPAGLFCFVDHRMGPPQWSDLGMFLQTFMLLAEEAGLGTCAQEAWAAWPETVKEFVGAPEELGIFCGMAIGHPDPDAPVNRLRSERMPLADYATFVER